MPRKNAIPSRTHSSNIYTTREDGTVELRIARSGQLAFIDATMADAFRKYTWRVRHERGGIKHLYCVKESLYGHHIVVGHPPEGKVVHHRNGNRFDLRRTNLEVTTQRVVQLHNSTQSNNTTGVRGVTFHRGSYLARISVNGVRKSTRCNTLQLAKDWILVHGAFVPPTTRALSSAHA